MKKFFPVLHTALCSAALALALPLSASAQAATLKVAATPVPHAEILNAVSSDLKSKGIDLKVVEFTDYIAPNAALDDKSVDANYFQHLPFLENTIQNRGYKIVSAGPVHIEPLGAYSRKVKNLKDLKEKAQVAIPNDPTNGARALLLLEKAGLIKLRAGAGLKSTVMDIAENPKKLKIVEIEAAQLPRTLDDVDAAVINSNYAIVAGLKPLSDALVMEDKNSPYANILAVRKGEENRPEIKALLEALRSEKAQKFMLEQYKGAVVPVGK